MIPCLWWAYCKLREIFLWNEEIIFGRIKLVYYITRGETQRLQTSVKFVARAKWGLQPHELHSLYFVLSNVYSKPRLSQHPFIATPVYCNLSLPFIAVNPTIFPPLISRRSGHVILKDRREYPSLLNLWCIYLYEFFVAINLLKGFYYIFLSVFGIHTYFERYIFFLMKYINVFEILYLAVLPKLSFMYILLHICVLYVTEKYKNFSHFNVYYYDKL